MGPFIEYFQLVACWLFLTQNQLTLFSLFRGEMHFLNFSQQTSVLEELTFISPFPEWNVLMH
jgi:hypothetical protein